MVKRGIKFLLFIFLVFFSLPVFASEFNMNNYTSATQDGTKNRYRGVEIVQTGMPGTFTFGTRYTGKLSTLETYFDYPFEANTTYTLTYNMNTEDFRNTFAAKYWWDCDNNEMNALNQHLGSFTYISYKKVKFSFTPTENTQCIRVLLGSSNQSSQAITGVNNWRLDSITLYDPAFQSGSSGGQGTSPSPSPSPSGATNQDIINNQNNNTEDIINNNNQNTQDIIENNNQNSQNIIDSNLVCKSYSLNDSGTLFDGYLGSTGIFYTQTGNHNKTTDFILIPEDSRVFLKKSSSTNKRICFYNAFRENTGCYTTNEFDNGHEFSIPINSVVFRINFEVSENSPIIDFCTNGNQAINDTLTDSNVDNGTGSNFFNDFSTDDNGGISAIVTKPLVIVNHLLENNGQCTNLQLPAILGVNGAYFPSGCILWDRADNTMVSIWNIIVVGFSSYFILKDLFRLVEDIKNPNNDKVEVIDL